MADVEGLASREGSIDKPGVEDVAVPAVKSDGVDPDFRRLDGAGNPSKPTVIIPPPIEAADLAASRTTFAAEGGIGFRHPSLGRRQQQRHGGEER